MMKENIVECYCNLTKERDYTKLYRYINQFIKKVNQEQNIILLETDINTRQLCHMK